MHSFPQLKYEQLHLYAPKYCRFLCKIAFVFMKLQKVKSEVQFLNWKRHISAWRDVQNPYCDTIISLFNGIIAILPTPSVVCVNIRWSCKHNYHSDPPCIPSVFWACSVCCFYANQKLLVNWMNKQCYTGSCCYECLVMSGWKWVPSRRLYSVYVNHRGDFPSQV